MPETNKKIPNDNTAVRFRIAGNKYIHTGIYTITKGFEIYNSFMCYTLNDIDWWHVDDLEPL